MRANFRRRFLVCLPLALAFAAPAAGQSARVLATDPPDGSVLNVGEALYVRVEYAGQQPLRFRVSAYSNGLEQAALAGDTDDDDFWMLLIMLAGWSIPGYFVLQTILYRRWRDGWRTAALLPLLGTVPIVAYTLFALFMGSNLWPLVMLFTLPLAFVYLVVLTLAKRVFSPT